VALIFVSETTIGRPELDKVTFLELDGIGIVHTRLMIVVRRSHNVLHCSLTV
jgi:hypothetical protein